MRRMPSSELLFDDRRTFGWKDVEMVEVEIC